MSNGTAALILEALGQDQRRAIITTLAAGPASVGAIAAELPIERPAVSRHLKTLTEAGLVTYVTAGTRHLYALAPDGLAPLQVWLNDLWGGVLNEFAAHVTHVTQPEHTSNGEQL